MRSHCCPCSTSELTANFFWTAVVAVDRLPRSMMLQFLCASLRAHGSVRCHNNTHAYFVSGWEKEAERDDHFRTAPTENFGPTFKFCLPRSLVKLLSDSMHYFLLFSLYFRRLFQKSLCTLLWQITIFWRLSITNTNTLILGAEISHEVKTDLHLRRPEFLRLPASFRKPFQLTETRGFADHFLKISRSYSSGNLITAIFPVRSKVVSYDVLHDSLWYLVVCHSLFPESSSYLCIERKFEFQQFSPRGADWSVMMSCTIHLRIMWSVSCRKREKCGCFIDSALHRSFGCFPSACARASASLSILTILLSVSVSFMSQSLNIRNAQRWFFFTSFFFFFFFFFCCFPVSIDTINTKNYWK